MEVLLGHGIGYFDFEKVRNRTSLKIYQNLPSLEILHFKNMQLKGDSTDVYRVSVSSAPSSSSHDSGQDDSEAYGDVYMWGQVICDSSRTNIDRNINFSIVRKDILLPKPLESNIVLDVKHVACGVKHSALVTRQGEVFMWGEESGGLLGHGKGTEAIYPCLVESLSAVDIEFTACGEFHTCAVSTSGELYTWGDSAHKAGLLGHGTSINHWFPKRISGPLEGLQVSSVSCGTWHTALITVTGQLFTFGDGTFGALGHGDRESVFYPREVESLIGLKTSAVSCGVWHTAAVVEVIVTQSSESSGKLFTWGDGDKYRLGHGDKESRFKPTCVPSLIDYIFLRIACGHSLTVGLTTSGHVFTMGSPVYGQLGNPHSDGKLPCLVHDNLVKEFVKEVACGSYHVAVLTSRSEVYTWGKGANGRLGLGDLEDRAMPTIVDALKDRQVKHIACGANFTAAVCQHKSVSSTEQSLCTDCRQAFGFTRKRHNCYNCGLVHCHSCSSRKSLGAALAPNPGKAYRVCDSCYVKLNRVTESAKSNDKRSALPRFLGESKNRSNKADFKKSKAVSPSNLDLLANQDTKAAKQRKKTDAFSLIGPLQLTPLSQLTDSAYSFWFDTQLENSRLTCLSEVQSINHSHAVSPFSQNHSPPYFATPIPSTSSHLFSESIAVSLKKTNELLNQEVQKMRGQVDNLRRRCEIQEYELQKSASEVQEARALAAEELAKSRAAKDVIKSLTQQLKDMTERLPQGAHEASGDDQNGVHPVDLAGVQKLLNDTNVSQIHSAPIQPGFTKVVSGQNSMLNGIIEAPGMNKDGRSPTAAGLNMNSKHIRNGEACLSNFRPGYMDGKDTRPFQNVENGSKHRSSTFTDKQVEAEWSDQYEPGVHLTLIALRDGSRELKRVRFSRSRFGEQQAETWWSEHRHKVYEKYNIRVLERSSLALSPQSAG
ncbi:uncharacterized protein LOC110031136 isoform X2 [Phalaenopsis equestris]|uniref:uncharacterized protein LOC110031136 isoform X2 n=1 Tax=Phalaenopsis equestris TaxID=78828 RepID=UPI0009E446C1|nr:uncharacterized protein LOC110031136 isoform X2 [Phalaenopsis equestris]